MKRGYVLDGIGTAMTISAGLVTCPCGWEAPINDIVLVLDVDALRFHYTHCPEAKKAHGPITITHIPEVP